MSTVQADYHGQGKGEPRLVSDHTYDGIQEYDNPTPGWWHVLFIATVLFAGPYYVIWELNPEVPTLAQSLETEQVAELKKQFAELGELKIDQDTVLKLSADEKWQRVGASIFKAKCATCHGSNAEGGSVGPNMTDDYYKNVKVVMDIPRVIQEGANGGAMPSWKNQLSTNEIAVLAGFVVSRRGLNLPSPRGPEGEKAPPFPAYAGPKPAGKS